MISTWGWLLKNLLVKQTSLLFFCQLINPSQACQAEEDIHHSHRVWLQNILIDLVVV